MHPNLPEEERKDGEESDEYEIRTTEIKMAQKRNRRKQLEKLRNIILLSSDISCEKKIKKVHRWLDRNKHNTTLLEYASEKRGVMPPIFLILSMKKITPDLVETMIKHAPKAVQLSKYLGNSSLHYALDKKIPLDVLTILLKSYPEIVKVTNNHGCLPLHYAFSKNKKMRPLLLKAYPEEATVQTTKEAGYSSLEYLPLAYLPLFYRAVLHGYMEVTKILLDEYPEGARVTDNNGQLPLHLLCAMQSQLNKLDIHALNQIIESYPESITQKNIAGDDPSNLLITLDPWRINMPLSMIPTEWHARSVIQMHFKIGCALHEAAIRILSPHLVKLLIKASPQSCTMKDHIGRVPLHHACTRISVRSLDIVIVLFEACEESFMIPDENGITPSQLFSNLASQKNGNDMLPLHRHARYSERFTVSALHQLFNAYPKGIEERDNRGMLPFHHACLNTASSVDTLMALLQLYPESIAE